MSSSPEAPQTIPPRVALFPPGAPDVALGGLGINRALLQRGAPTGAEDDTLRWTIFGIPDEDVTGEDSAAPFTLVGDFALNAEGWFVGLTVTAPTYFREAPAFQELTDTELNDLSHALGQWASHLLYDFATSHARHLVAGTWGCEISIPLQTPEPRLLDVSRDADTVPTDLDLDVAGSRPQLDLDVQVERPGVLGRPHVDRRVGQRVHLDLLAGETKVQPAMVAASMGHLLGERAHSSDLRNSCVSLSVE